MAPLGEAEREVATEKIFALLPKDIREVREVTDGKATDTITSIPAARQAVIDYLNKKLTPADIITPPAAPESCSLREERTFQAEEERIRNIKEKLAENQQNIAQALDSKTIELKLLNIPEEIRGTVYYLLSGSNQKNKIDLFTKSSFLFDCPLPASIDPSVRECLEELGLDSIGKILMDHHGLYGISRSVGLHSRRYINSLSAELSKIGLPRVNCSALEPSEFLKFERKPPKEFLAAYPEINKKFFPQRKILTGYSGYEIHDSAFEADINNAEISLLPGCTYSFTNLQQAKTFSDAAEKIIKASNTYLLEPIVRMKRGGYNSSQYLVHLSDSALETLSTSEALATFNEALNGPAKKRRKG